jgi:hypothetical protein
VCRVEHFASATLHACICFTRSLSVLLPPESSSP